MSRVHSFPPLAGADPRLLILGSMPGEASLRAAQYYAHRHNQFWPIMSALFGFAPDVPYAERCQRLLDAGIAVWDVLQSCERPGSLDSAIVPASVLTNDFAGFFMAHPTIGKVFFNGSAAEQLFLRHVSKRQALPAELQFRRLPSTSPAHASLRPAEKLMYWREALLS